MSCQSSFTWVFEFSTHVIMVANYNKLCFSYLKKGDDFVHKKNKEQNLNKTTTCMYKCII